ncbi:alpha/beta hydrolase family protein [Ktedonobacter racemifer]|uniref:BD-FAE-like domain-containing protein n=1 Tax=Ktedonobacter racemifer DSM 44963 TaxID=485913 RepID=D6THN5_KTERA|nr:alpha/beta hydrolase [Ktedonobacter racemifer]EFH89040.1 conserved hypothetical protein [Ktedonobacter racemifer DSM 44963]
MQAISLAYGSESQQFGELYVPPGPGSHPVVVLIHGGFWRAPYDLTLMEGLAQDLVGHGIAVWNIEYRRVGDPGGAWPGTLQDVAVATDYLRPIAPTYALDLDRVISVGHSAGGHLALWLAGRSHIAKTSQIFRPSPLQLTGVISLAGASDLELVWKLNLGKGAAAELLGGGPAEVGEHYASASPTALLPFQIPQVLVHGDADDRVPLSVSQVYAQQAQQAGDAVRLISLPDTDHFELIDAKSQAWTRTREEILALLKSPGRTT